MLDSLACSLRSHDRFARSYLKTGEVVFPASAAVVIMDTEQNTQRFFLEHDDDVTAVAVTTKIENQILLTSPQGKQDQPDVQLRAQVVRYERRLQARESVQQK